MRPLTSAVLRAALAPLCLTTSFAVAAPPIRPPAQTPAQTPAQMDRDLLEVTIPQLESFYATHRYTVEQVTEWYLDRIARYDPRYKAIIHVNAAEALAAAAAEDAAASPRRQGFHPGPMCGVPIVIKANTSIKGLITYRRLARASCIPGHELVAPQDATVVAKLRAAGAIILGQTNMPDFAASDTNRSTAFGRTGNAYDVRFTPGGSSGGTVTAVTANFAVLGTGTDTANSIRMPSGTSAVVGVLPTRGLVSIAGIAPLDWLLDNTGPIARNVTDAAIALGVMAGEDPLDFRTKGSAAKAQPGPYTQYLKADALKGKRFGVPAFIVAQPQPPAADAPANPSPARNALRPETRALFLKALDEMRAAGATIVLEDDLLSDSFQKLVQAVNTRPYRREGTDSFLHDFGPADYRSIDDYDKATGSPLPATVGGPGAARGGNPPVARARPAAPLAIDPARRNQLLRPAARRARRLQRGARQVPPRRLRLSRAPDAAQRRNHPPARRPPVERPAQQHRLGQQARRPRRRRTLRLLRQRPPHGHSSSPHAPGRTATLLGFAYAFEQATDHRQPPVLVDQPRPEEPN